MQNMKPTETTAIPVANATGSIDYHDAASEEAHVCAKELATVLLEKNFDTRRFAALLSRLKRLNYDMPRVQNCMLSRFTMSVALGMSEASPGYSAWMAGFQRLGTAPFAVTKAEQEANNLRAKYDGDEKALQKAVFDTFFTKGDIPRK